MKKSIIYLALSLKLFAFEYNEDEIKTIDNSSFNIHEAKKEIKQEIKQEPEQKGREVVVDKIEEEKYFTNIDYKDIKYQTKYGMYSVIPTNKTEFMNYVKNKNLSIEKIKTYKNKVSNQNTIEFNAFMYDYYLDQPNIAENYYKMFKDFDKISLVDHKIRYADFLIRTGRPDEIEKVLEKRDCLSNITNSGICFYYIGVADYLLTGNNKNSAIRISKSSIAKAGEIYNLKRGKNR